MYSIVFSQIGKCDVLTTEPCSQKPVSFGSKDVDCVKRNFGQQGERYVRRSGADFPIDRVVQETGQEKTGLKGKRDDVRMVRRCGFESAQTDGSPRISLTEMFRNRWIETRFGNRIPMVESL